MTDQYTSLEKLFVEVAYSVRDRLAAANLRGYHSFKCNSSGRVQDGDLKFSFEVYVDDTVKAAHIEPAVVETMRRAGWEALNDPVCLPAPTAADPQVDEAAPDDEIPY